MVRRIKAKRVLELRAEGKPSGSGEARRMGREPDTRTVNRRLSSVPVWGPLRTEHCPAS